MTYRIIDTDEAHHALDAYEADDENDGPMLGIAGDALHTVITQAAQVERLLAENERLTDERDAARDTRNRGREIAAQAFDDLVVRVWCAATGDTHEGPASVETLLSAVSDLRERLRVAEEDASASRLALDEAREALRALAPQCSQCEAIATRWLDGYGGGEAARCDACSPSPESHPWSYDLPHADALRAAGGSR